MRTAKKRAAVALCIALLLGAVIPNAAMNGGFETNTLADDLVIATPQVDEPSGEHGQIVPPVEVQPPSPIDPESEPDPSEPAGLPELPIPAPQPDPSDPSPAPTSDEQDPELAPIIPAVAVEPPSDDLPETEQHDGLPDDPDGDETLLPDSRDVEELIEEPQLPGTLRPGEFCPLVAAPGDVLELAIPVIYATEERLYASNADEIGTILPYRSNLKPSEFDQTIAQLLPEVSIQIAEAQAADFPLEPDILTKRSALIANGKNRGYALFDGARVREDAQPGSYPVRLYAETTDASGLSQFQPMSGVITIATDNPLVVPIPRDGLDEIPLVVPHVSDIEQRDSGEPASSGYVQIAQHEEARAAVGAPITIAVPIRYASGTYEDEFGYKYDIEPIYNTNERTSGDSKSIVPYAEGQASGEFDQFMIGSVSNLTITMDADQAADFPLENIVLPASQPLVAGGINSGYAVFQALVKSDAVAGLYPIKLTASFTDAGGSVTASLTEYIQIGATEQPILYGTSGIIVFTFLQLRTVLTESAYNSYDTVYLGYCNDKNMTTGWEQYNGGTIQQPTIGTGHDGIRVNRSVHIIGTDPRNQHRMMYIDHPFNDAFYGIRPASTGLTIKLSHVNVTGNNNTGVVTGVSVNYTTIEFVDVNYVGRQMVYNRGIGSSVSFRDCNVKIQPMTSGDAQEVAEAPVIDLYGTCRFDRTHASIGGTTVLYSVFWLVPHTRRLTVHSGANITVETNNYFLYNDGLSPILTIDGKLDVTTKGHVGSMTYYLESIATCNVNGTLAVHHNYADNTYPAMRVNTLNVTGTLLIDKLGSTEPCIQSTGFINFNSPRRVDLRNPGGRLIQGGGTLNITTNVINRFTTSNDKLIWNNIALSDISVKAAISNTACAIESDYPKGLEDNQGVSLPPRVGLSTGTFNIATLSTRLLLGDYSLSIDPETVYHTSPMVKGNAPSGSSQIVEEYPLVSGALGTKRQSSAAITKGDRFRTGDDWERISAGDGRVYVLSKLNDLEAHVYVDSKPICMLQEVPENLDYGIISIPTAQIEVPRTAPMAVKVLDTDPGSNWSLYVSAQTDLVPTGDGDPLPDRLFFKENETTPSVPIGIALPGQYGPKIGQKPADRPADGVTTFAWPPNEGIVLGLQAGDGEIDETYTATLTWTLVQSVP